MTIKPKKENSQTASFPADGVTFAMNIRDRIVLENVLPPEGDWLKVAISEDIAQKVRMTTDEKGEAIRNGVAIPVHGAGPGAIDFDEDKLASTRKAVSFDKREAEFIRDTLNSKAAAGKLPRAAARIYRIFVLSEASA